MASSLQRIDVDLVESLAAQIKQQRDGPVTELLSRLRAINGEIANAWDASAQDQFEATYGTWINDLERFSNKLNDINMYLVTVARNYRELDEAARRAAAQGGGS